MGAQRVPKWILNQSKIDEKTDLVTAGAAKAHVGAPGNTWGYPPGRKRVQKLEKKVFGNTGTQTNCGRNRDGAKYVPLTHLPECGGLGEGRWKASLPGHRHTHIYTNTQNQRFQNVRSVLYPIRSCARMHLFFVLPVATVVFLLF